jgi:WW domain-containing oxidoreductase
MRKSRVFGARSTADQVLAGIDLTGKHFLVTGGASGIGLQTASALAANGGHVIVIARTLDDARGPAARSATTAHPCNATWGTWMRDRRRGRGSPVAGASGCHRCERRRRQSRNAVFAHGVEQQFFVNHVGHFALLNELASLLRDGTGRVVIVSSSAAGRGRAPRASCSTTSRDNDSINRTCSTGSPSWPMPFTRRNCRAGWDRAASRSIAPIRARSAAHPSPTLERWRDAWRGSPHGPSAIAGARCRHRWHAGRQPDAAGVSGEYWRDCKMAPGNPLLDDADLGLRLWESFRGNHHRPASRTRATRLMAQAA